MLKPILDNKLKEIAEKKKVVPLGEIREMAYTQPPTRGFKAALIRKSKNLKIIAELKKASPSRGTLCRDFNVHRLAALYEQAGASAISVITDERYFGGSLSNLSEARKITNLPLLCKDFILDPYQIYEARCAGADAVLLIAGALTPEKLYEFLELAEKLHMDCLVEAHTASEIEDAIGAGASIIGINNRNLRDFKVNLEITVQLIRYLPRGCAVVSESGFKTREDACRVAALGVDAILVGEGLVTSPNPGRKIRELQVEKGARLNGREG